jgi:spore coat polysaccharide biosynthesis protein SpsF
MLKNKFAIILARLDSKRFPSKLLSKIDCKLLIEWSLFPFIKKNEIDVVLATTNREIDNPLVDIAVKYDIKYFRGDCENVALRVKNCIEKYNIECFARINADSPFVQEDLLIEGFYKIEHENYEFVTNLYPRAFPYGISLEILKSETYLNNFKNFVTDTHKEHITSYFYENIKNFNYYNMAYKYGNDHDVRLVIDTYEDKERIESILKRFPENYQPSLSELIIEYKKIN